MEKEKVHHPEHYGGSDNVYEAIKVIEAHGLDFHLGNAVKYILRAGKKEDEKTDLQKAIWYLQRRLENIEREPASRDEMNRFIDLYKRYVKEYIDTFRIHPTEKLKNTKPESKHTRVIYSSFLSDLIRHIQSKILTAASSYNDYYVEINWPSLYYRRLVMRSLKGTKLLGGVTIEQACDFVLEILKPTEIDGDNSHAMYNYYTGINRAKAEIRPIVIEYFKENYDIHRTAD